MIKKRIVKRFLGIIKIIILKIKYRKKFIFSKKIIKGLISEISNISILDGTIKIEGQIFMKKNSIVAVNKNGKIFVGDRCSFNTNAICCSLGEITIGNNVSIGPNVCIYDHDHAFDENGKIKDKYNVGIVKIGNNVWLGAGVIVLKDTEIGDNCVIGAGTVVKGKIPSNSLVTSDRNLKIKRLENR